jgi:signal transduction histidine kinase
VIATVAGWLAASLAATLALVARRLLTVRMEAVARASHELRGPLTAARLGLQLGIRSGRLPADRLRAIDLELGSAALALEDLDGAATRRRVAHVGDPAAADEIDLHELVADSVEAWRALAEAYGVALRIRWSGGPGRVLGDRLRLAQAMGNLIANAIEHGGGDVELRGTHHRDAVRLEVIDGGASLPAPVDELARRAGRGRNRAERDRRRAGRGRGLAIAVAVAEAHGGRLAAAPSERGARVVLELPAARRDAPASGSAAGPEDRPAPA